MAQSDGSDLEQHRRQRILEIQDALRDDYPHHLPPGTLLLRCPHCTRVYPLNHFPRNAQRRYGVRLICRACLSTTRPKTHHDPDPGLTEKRCRVCRATRPIAAFYLDRSQPDGYSSRCRDCALARRRDALEERHYDDVVTERREQTLKLCGELGIDYPDHDILRCRRCGAVKPINEFTNDWRYAARKKPVCRDCRLVGG